MKLLILSPRFPSPRFPMSGNVKSYFALELKRLGVEVEIVAPIPFRINIFRLIRDMKPEYYDEVITYHPVYLRLPHILNKISLLGPGFLRELFQRKFFPACFGFCLLWVGVFVFSVLCLLCSSSPGWISVRGDPRLPGRSWPQ